jgi:hypothetical protein
VDCTGDTATVTDIVSTLTVDAGAYPAHVYVYT